MRVTIHAFFPAFLLLLLSCNSTQTNKKGEQTAAEKQTVENESADDSNEPNRQRIDLFRLDARDSSSNVAFTSLSDIYLFSGTDSDTLVLPNIEKKGMEAAQYFVLEAKYRERFLSKTKIAETDSVFVCDYAKNKLASFVVSKLKVAAMINVYASESDWPYPLYYYMVGFEIDKKKVAGFSDYYSDVLVYVGKENVFTQEPLTPIVWKKIAAKDYPSKALTEEDEPLQSMTPANTYVYEAGGLQYFLQDYLGSDKLIYGRRLLVVESATKEVVITKVFGRGEGTSPSPLNYDEEAYGGINQWTGKLFKNEPPVVFGFEYISFGCPSISIIDKSNEDIYINCDNRH